VPSIAELAHGEKSRTQLFSQSLIHSLAHSLGLFDALQIN